MWTKTAPRNFTGSTLALCLILILWTEVSIAQNVPPTPDTEEGDSFQWSIGGGVVVSPRPYVDSDPEVIPIPVFTARYKRFFFQGIRGGFDFLRNDKWSASVFGQAQFKGLEPGDSSYLEGIETRKKSMDGGLELLYKGRPVGFRAALLQDMLGRSKGREVSLMATTGAPLGPVLVIFGIGPRWLSQDRADYYYGVRPFEARFDRPSFQGEAGWNWDLNVTTRVKLSSKWSLFALFNREGLNSSTQQSPLLDRGSAYSLVMYVGREF